MLYVQQKISEQNFIVADTDDDTEEMTTCKELKHCVIDLGVEVLGTTYSIYIVIIILQMLGL